MEWLYGLLIGSTFTAVLMHLAHRGHRSERARYEKEGYKVQPNGMIEPKIKEPWYVPGDTELYSKVDDVPKDCTCDWQENKRLCEEDGDWYRTMQDPECPVHKYGDACVRDYEKMVKRWIKDQ